MLVWMLLALAQDAGADEAPPPGVDRVALMLANYHALTRAEIPCHTTHDDGEIVVCARRNADRYRVPLVAEGGPETSVPLRTATLTRDYGHRPCGETAFTAQCGPGFGVGVTMGAGGTRLVERPLAP